MNTPNAITLTRILMVPVIVFFYLATFIPYGRLVAAVLFIIACLTDFLDGYLARKYNKVTTLGKFFDTIADKILIMTGLILITAAGVIGEKPVVFPTELGVVCAIVILAREFIVSALRQLAAAKGKVLAADKCGKVKAVAQYVAVSLYMIDAFLMTDINPLLDADVAKKLFGFLNFILMIILIAATLLTIYSGAVYLIRNRRVFSSEKPSNFTESQEEIADEDAIKDEATHKVVEAKVSITEEEKQAAMLFLNEAKVSGALLQKEMNISGVKASKILSRLEELEIISPEKGKKRKLLITKQEFENKF